MITERLNALRQAMQRYHLDVYIIPTADPHLSEYLPQHWQAREYFSGFTGSAGTLIVQRNSAQLWTDSRYWKQAETELAPHPIELCKQEQGRNYLVDLLANLPKNARIGIPSDMLSLTEERQLKTALAEHDLTLWYEHNLIDEVWQSNRPDLPKHMIFAQEALFVPHSTRDKLQRVRQAMQHYCAQYHLISSLDDIAWLTNLRGQDIEFNPVFLSHLLISQHDAILFTNPNKLTPEILQALDNVAIDIAPYEQLSAILATLQGNLLLDPAKVAVINTLTLPSNVQLIEQANPTSQFKAEKSIEEIAHIRTAMRQDGIALCGFFAQLEQKLAQNESLNEHDIDALLYQHRHQREHFVSPSFATIAGFNANGAMPHYSAPAINSAPLVGNGLLLIDSGGQYHSGTTDITRVMPIGTPSAEQIRDFTLVLKAHIALATAVFPEGIAAPMIDAICRAPLWQAQCDYGHGTGHGVGYFLNVHEGPQRISYHAPNRACYALRIGMLTSNEPALYRPNKWGIRIENLVVCQPVDTPKETEFGQYLCFETVTLCPIDTRLINVQLLTPAELDWLNHYHAHVRNQLLPYVDGIARDWLITRTQAI